VVARELGAGLAQVRATAELLAGGATVPFIARYRKEATGSLDEVAVAAVRDRMAQLADLDKRRAAIMASLSERGLLDDELARRIEGAGTLTDLEDAYLPYRPKRRTRGMVAREQGLEALAEALLAQTGQRIDVSVFVDPGRGVADREAALAGARDIIAEDVAENPDDRRELRRLFAERAVLSSTTSTGPSPWPMPPPTASWPCFEGATRDSSGSMPGLTRLTPWRGCAGATCADMARPPRRWTERWRMPTSGCCFPAWSGRR
jgi:uncharacterized protein